MKEGSEEYNFANKLQAAQNLFINLAEKFKKGKPLNAKNAESAANTDEARKEAGIKAKEIFEAIKGLQKKADKSGMPYSILKKVYDRGMAAWRGGHRPGASQQQWAFARVNSFITKSSGTWGGADKDLAAKVKGK